MEVVMMKIMFTLLLTSMVTVFGGMFAGESWRHERFASFLIWFGVVQAFVSLGILIVGLWVWG